MTDASKIGRKSRRKGKTGEREVCELLRTVYPQDAGWIVERGWQSCGGVRAPDVIVRREGESRFDLRWWIEVKRMKRPNPARAIEQAVADSKGHSVPVAFTRADGAGWLVTMRAEDWLDLIGGRDE